ncbi:hypothetical protein K7432_008704 [Basidiobolus ranarum]|uniref:Uncharacterized protein n=1 Tax=Basidiobolus ranarum TaxID=34480 RepID=A0ABR2VZ28_9FUNG
MELNTINYRISDTSDKSPVPIPNEGHYFRRRGVKIQLKGLPHSLTHTLSSSPNSRLQSTDWSSPSGSVTVTDRRITYLADVRIQGIETILFPLGTLAIRNNDTFNQKVVKAVAYVNNFPVSVSFRFSKRGDAKDFISYASMLQGSMMAANRLTRVDLSQSLNQPPPGYHEVSHLERLPPYAA